MELNPRLDKIGKRVAECVINNELYIKANAKVKFPLNIMTQLTTKHQKENKENKEEKKRDKPLLTMPLSSLISL